MKNQVGNISLCLITLSLLLAGCNQKQSKPAVAANYGGFATKVEWGQHLVLMGGCNDCHTPKKMTAAGPVPDMTLMMSGHPSDAPDIQVDRKDIEGKGLMVTSDLTAWVGPWGVSYAANLTPDETGIGNWTEAQFFKAIREQKFMGLDGTRPLMPPMNFVAEGLSAAASDSELSAIFAYLKTIKPVHNVVQQPKPPVTAMPH